MITNVEARDPIRVGMLLSLFSDQTRDGIIAAISTNPAGVREGIARSTTSSKSIPAIMAVTDRAHDDILSDMIRGLASVIGADMAMTAFDKRRAALVLKFLGLPETAMGPLASNQDELESLVKSDKLRNMRALSAATTGAVYRPATIYAWYLLIGKAVGEAQQLQSLMEEPAIGALTNRIGEGDVSVDAQREMGDALLADAGREQADAMSLPLPEAGAPILAAVAPTMQAARFGTGSYLSLKRRRRRRRLARAAALQPLIAAEVAKGLESPEPVEQRAAQQAAQGMEPSRQHAHPEQSQRHSVQSDGSDDREPREDRNEDDWDREEF